ncbi:MAG: hypothetical protein KAQ83_02000 [Nanoarchaeota archaeon]|nr:hypothetical protein [Nanoarchaeota archaeon]
MITLINPLDSSSLKYSAKLDEERLENLYSISIFVKLAESKNKNSEKKEEEEQGGKKKQGQIINALKKIDNKLYRNWNEFEKEVKIVLDNIDLTPNFIKSIILALSEHDDTADYVLDSKGKKQTDSNLRDNEKIRLTENIEEYFKKEVLPYYKDAWMDRSKDKIGYEINFTKHFYKYVSPRDLGEIEKDIKSVTDEIDGLLKKEL